MSAAAVSCTTIRPVRPFLGPVDPQREETSSYRAGALGLSVHPPTPEPGQLLVIDDDPAGLPDQLRRAFPAPGYRVQFAGSGSCGLRHVGADSPDVVLLGLGSCAPSGLEVFQQIRQIDARVPVIFMAGERRANGKRAVPDQRHRLPGHGDIDQRRGESHVSFVVSRLQHHRGCL